MKKLLVLLCIALAASVSAWTQERGLEVVARENLGGRTAIGRQYALFIAVDDYDYWPALKRPVADARGIREILTRDYFIDETIELYNAAATKERIIETFVSLQQKLGIHDSLFIYYAGHGHLDKASDHGFWIPVNGGVNTLSQENWLSNSQIRGYIANLKTIHVFLASDACFSGDILDTTRALPLAIDNAYFRSAYALTSRQVLTSGASETVPDQSEFATALRICLEKNTQSLIDPHSIYNDVRLSVRNSTPLYGTLKAASHQDGATFLFFRRGTAASPPRPGRIPSYSASVGSVTVTSGVAGTILIDGVNTSQRIKEGGKVTLGNIATGNTRVSVRGDDGKVYNASGTVMVREGATVSVTVARPLPVAAPAVQPAARIERPVPGGFVRVEGGTFFMGSNDGYSDEKPVHNVTVKSFNIGKCEVTQKEWVEVMGSNPSQFKGDNRPVENVSWNDVVGYCNRRSRKEGLTPVYAISGNSVTWNRNADGYRLPTEAEWEFAAEGGTKGGAEYTYSGSNSIDAVAWYDGNSGRSLHDVGTKTPNSLGLYDMSGNVWEWCWDGYGGYPSGAQTDPVGVSSGSNRVGRGGSWANSAESLRSAFRFANTPTGRGSNLGFRLVRSAL